jgi:transcriptional regulator GlxA family with amidase domain
VSTGQRALDVVLLLFDGCDLMDVAGPNEVLLTANRLAARGDRPVPFRVRSVSPDGRAVAAYGGVGLVPDAGAAHGLDALDVVVVPGLVDIDAGVDDAVLVATVAGLAASADLVVSVCTGAFLLDAAGALGDVEATTHWEDAALLAQRRTAGVVRDDVRWVDAGHVVTAGGITAGIDMALHLVARFVDDDLARATARQIDHVWRRAR